jgi:hypothetical protein
MGNQEVDHFKLAGGEESSQWEDLRRSYGYIAGGQELPGR